MLIAIQFEQEIQQLKLRLKSEFEMKELGEAKKILGIKISTDKQQRRIFLSQKYYLAKLSSRFGMANAKVVNVPFASHFKLSLDQSPKDEESRKEMENIPYSSTVGSLMYSMVCTWFYFTLSWEFRVSMCCVRGKQLRVL